MGGKKGQKKGENKSDLVLHLHGKKPKGKGKGGPGDKALGQASSYGSKWNGNTGWNTWTCYGCYDDCYSFTGPRAQDPNYVPPDEKKSKHKIWPVVDSLPGTYEGEGATKQFWGGRAYVGNMFPCDCCGKLYGLPHCMVQCKLSDGHVPNTAGTMQRVGKAKEALDVLPTLKLKVNKTDTSDSESTNSTISTAASSADTTATPTKKSFEGMKGEATHNVCWQCYGEKFKGDANFFLHQDGVRLSSTWNNLRNRAKGCPKKEDLILENLFNQAEKVLLANGAETEEIIKLAQVKEIIMETPHVAIAADWNPVLSPGCFCLYRCCGCHIAPLRQNKWVRVINKEMIYLPDGTETNGGSWRCAAKYGINYACLADWKKGQRAGSSCLAIPRNSRWAALTRFVFWARSPVRRKKC